MHSLSSFLLRYNPIPHLPSPILGGGSRPGDVGVRPRVNFPRAYPGARGPGVED